MRSMRARTVAVEYNEAEAFVELMKRLQALKGLSTRRHVEGPKPPIGPTIRTAERFAKDRQSMATRLNESVLEDGRILYEISPGDLTVGQGSASVIIDRAGKPELQVEGKEPAHYPSITDRKFRKALDDAVSPRGGKFANIKKIEVEGIIFHSPVEARRYVDLRQRERFGEISELERQVPYKFEENGRHCFTYLADFVYRIAATGEQIVEDVKGMPTDIYRLKKKLIEARFGIEITEWPLSKKELERRAKAEAKKLADAEKAERRRVQEEQRAEKKAREAAQREERERIRAERAAEKSLKPKRGTAKQTPDLKPATQ